MRLSPKDGAIVQVVDLLMDEIATAMTLDARGQLVVTGGGEGVFTVDLATGKTAPIQRSTGVLLTGIVAGR